jgi:hypothetical protein
MRLPVNEPICGSEQNKRVENRPEVGQVARAGRGMSRKKQKERGAGRALLKLKLNCAVV